VGESFAERVSGKLEGQGFRDRVSAGSCRTRAPGRRLDGDEVYEIIVRVSVVRGMPAAEMSELCEEICNFTRRQDYVTSAATGFRQLR
jgi:hypothetical protein